MLTIHCLDTDDINIDIFRFFDIMAECVIFLLNIDYDSMKRERDISPYSQEKEDRHSQSVHTYPFMIDVTIPLIYGMLLLYVTIFTNIYVSCLSILQSFSSPNIVVDL